MQIMGTDSGLGMLALTLRVISGCLLILELLQWYWRRREPATVKSACPKLLIAFCGGLSDAEQMALCLPLLSLTRLWGVGTFGSACKVKGGAPCQWLEWEGKLQGGPCPHCATQVTACELSTSSTFHPDLHSLPPNPILRSLYHRTPVNWHRLHDGHQGKSHKERDWEARAELKEIKCQH